MGLMVQRPTAAISTLLATALAVLGVRAFTDAARRPYYGGTLRVEIRAQLESLDPKEPASSAEEFAMRAMFGAAAAGPFRVTNSEANKNIVLAANDDYRGGRPYLDSIEILMGRDLKDQALDLSLGKADVTETGERQGKLTNTLALVFESDRIAQPVREALSLAIDRATIQKVLAKNGEAASALLPQWL